MDRVARVSNFENPLIDNRLRYFTYIPVNIAPEISLAAYFVVGAVLVWQIVHYRAQRWLYILPGTAFAEALGYAFRTACVYKTTFGMYVAMMLFLLVPPNALALANYKAVAKIIRSSPAARPRVFWLKPGFVNWFYFASDVFSICMQGAGGGMLTGTTTRDAGRAVVLVGLTVQLFFFACYLATSFYVWWRPEYTVHVSPRFKSHQQAKRRVMLSVTTTTVLLYIRSIYRIAEFGDGYGGKIYSSEWAFYVFDTIVIFLMFIVYIVLFIGHSFPREGKIASMQLSSAENQPVTSEAARI
ncbi:hypothetical protein LPJ78_005022 [Coemansia sp. RSA 989]|nr:RTA1 like protein-domain-containing protein [Coemansia mojavensis]KAJ1739928.1 hypothetical protein LPJ68_004244 [Coemansia sp. RSA 1086]KAJ1748382.1 hypothetical protein LPJ79_004574 [Coemansia sp. RSA 1821]KAJ1861967.1 hypothetical protein LPJ78_005022 [Coemansia sp. RSA 989]KAJ1869902.1 hypothetical protein LPJ55_005058 [Coemansia sp. RSA 990]KAJ2668023.1 hypothetical protein IWW42_005522 [Coemansia sp. RSA 1085]